MQVWKLTPVNGKGYVRIRAKSEARAREIALTTFEGSNVNKTLHSIDWSNLPWQDPNYVHCELEENDISNQEGFLDIV